MFRFFNKAPHVPCGESILFQLSVLSDLRNILGHLPYKVFTTKSFSPQNVNSSTLSVRKTSHGLRVPWSPWLADCAKLLSKPWRPWRWHAWGKAWGTGNLSSNWNRVNNFHVVLDEVVTVAFVNMHPCWNPYFMIPKRLQCRQKIFSSKPDCLQFQDHAHVMWTITVLLGKIHKPPSSSHHIHVKN